jgi:predicted transcriptional regulator
MRRGSGGREVSIVDFKLNLDTETVQECHPLSPLCLAPTDTAAEAIQLMKAQSRGAVLVCHQERIEGIFTERDSLRMMAAGANFDQPLAECMTPDPVILRASDKVGKAISLMARGGYRRLPIVDEKGRPIGIVSVGGILRYLVEHFPSVIYNLPPEPHHATQQREGA